MADRYFVESPILPPRAVLSGPEAHHLAHVARARPGQEVTLFDGGGAEFAAVVVEVRRAEVILDVGERRDIDREPKRPLVLGVALPKGDRQRWLVEKAVELGVAELAPLETARGVARPEAAALARLRRAVIEASKQCGRNRLMRIAAPRPWLDYMSQIEGGLRLVAHPGGLPVRDCVSQSGEKAMPVHLAVGPEGGLTEAELEQARAAGWRPVDLGPRILRVETAAALLAAVLLVAEP